MVERYNNKPELRNYYCCHECEIGKIDAPEVAFGSVHEILVTEERWLSLAISFLFLEKICAGCD